MEHFPTSNAAPKPQLAGGNRGSSKKRTVSWEENRTRWAGSFALAVVLILIGFVLASAADKPVTGSPLTRRIPEMSVAGKVLEISDTSLKIERTLKGRAEIMEFEFEKASPEIAVGDQIKASYLIKDGRNILIRVAPAHKTAVRKGSRKDLPKEMKPVAPPAAPVTK